MNTIPDNSALAPFLEDKIWGNTRLGEIFKQPSLTIGEAFLVSILKNKESKYLNRPLSNYVNEKTLPYLIKLIDTSDNLSIQVHPDDEFAKKNENSCGKSECWLILEAKPGSGIYLGMKEGITRDDMKRSLQNGDDISTLLNFFPVKKGDFFHVNPQTAHAIGKDVFLIETQQICGITYRAWDWNRTDPSGRPRELHVDTALKVINFDPSFNSPNSYKAKSNCLNTSSVLTEHRDFKVESLVLSTNSSKQFNNSSSRAISLICLDGEAFIESKLLEKFHALIVMPGNSITVKTKKQTAALLVVS